MFTGIVTEVGAISVIDETELGRRYEIEAAHTASDLSIGDSVAVNGVCLTAIAVSRERFTVEAVHETLQRSSLVGLVVGDRVDLELPMRASGRFDGHIVQGHVDGVGTVGAIAEEGESRRMKITLPESLVSYVVEKGSIAVEGVSLTITAVSGPGASSAFFEVALIPHTLDSTVLGTRGEGDIVNLEVDVIAKYVARYVANILPGTLESMRPGTLQDMREVRT